jgi:hypothetical protein
VADDEVDVQGSGPPQELCVEDVALDGDVSAIDREIETYRLDARESTQALELSSCLERKRTASRI